MEAKIKSDRSETIFNRFLISNLVYRMNIPSICNIFDFRTLFHQGTDDQESMKMDMDFMLIHLQGRDENINV